MAETSKKGGSKMTEKEKNMEIFKIIKETRDFEIDMFWRRTNYFLLLNSAVGGGLLATLASFTDPELQITLISIGFFSVIGCFVCLAWIKIGLGSKFWQSHWEQVLVNWQKKVDLTGYDGDIFSTKYNKKRVKENLDMDDCYDFCVLKKPSVSRWMHRTACFFFLVWLFATPLYFIIYFIICKYITCIN